MYSTLSGSQVDRVGIVKLTEDDYFFHEVVDPQAGWDGYLQAYALHQSGKLDRFEEVDIFDLV